MLYGIVFSAMKQDIHPTTHATTLTCACGNSFATLSTKENVSTEICSNCHPFFTGKQKLVDSARRVEKHEEKQKKTEALMKERKHTSKKEKRAARAEKKTGGKEAKADAKAALKAAKAALSAD